MNQVVWLYAMHFEHNSHCFISILQNDFNTGLDLSEARASLLSGDVVELTNATPTDSTSMKLVWEVSISKTLSGFSFFLKIDNTTAIRNEYKSKRKSKKSLYIFRVKRVHNAIAVVRMQPISSAFNSIWRQIHQAESAHSAWRSEKY